VVSLGADPVVNRGPSSHYLVPVQLELDVNYTDCYPSTDGDNIFKYTVPHLNKSLADISFNAFKGKPILILNVATFCRSPIEYPLLNHLKDQFGDQLEIVGFPGAQFWNQEPSDTAEEIYNAIKYSRPGNGFVPKFYLTQKVDVNGPNTHPVFSFLKRSCTSTKSRFEQKEYLFYDPKNERDLKWNFEKFLIDPHSGQPLRRYDTHYSSDNIAKDIRELISKA